MVMLLIKAYFLQQFPQGVFHAVHVADDDEFPAGPVLAGLGEVGWGQVLHADEIGAECEGIWGPRGGGWGWGSGGHFRGWRGCAE